MRNPNLATLTPNLMVEDVNETVKYYEKVLGFNKVMATPEQGPYVWAMMQRDGVTIMFQHRDSIVEEYPEFKDKAVGSTSNLYIEVSNLNDYHDSIKNKAKIIKEPHMTFYSKREFALRDNNGYLFTFAECDKKD